MKRKLEHSDDLIEEPLLKRNKIIVTRSFSETDWTICPCNGEISSCLTCKLARLNIEWKESGVETGITSINGHEPISIKAANAILYAMHSDISGYHGKLIPRGREEFESFLIPRETVIEIDQVQIQDDQSKTEKEQLLDFILHKEPKFAKIIDRLKNL